MKFCVLDDLVIPKDLEDRIRKLGYDIVKDEEDYDVVLIRNITKVDRLFLDKNPKLRYVIRAGVGLDNVDLKLCEERGIKVINAPGSNAFSVAELFFFHVLNAIRYGCKSIEKRKSCKYVDRKEFVGNNLIGKVIGIVGLGYVGKEIVKRLQGWGVKEIVAYDIIKDLSFSSKYHVKYVSLEHLFDISDIIAICVPLTSNTEGMINKELLKLSNGVVLINLSRGMVVNEKDVLWALTKGYVSFYCADVLYDEKEPTKEDIELLSHPNVFITPHIGANTHESLNNMVREAIERWLRRMEKES